MQQELSNNQGGLMSGAQPAALPAALPALLPVADARRPARWGGWFTAGIVLALQLAFLLIHAAGQTYWTIDEVYTIGLVNHPVGALIDMTAIDAHPPTYYLALKLWNKALRLAGVEPGVFLGRLPGLLIWALLAGWVWRAARRRLGAPGAALVTAVALCSPHVAYNAANMRGYAFAIPALIVCFLLLAFDDPAARPRRSVAGWMLYALAAALALWSHLLAALVMGLLGFTWLWLGGQPAGRRRSFLIGGALAHAFALAAFAPWLVHLGDNLSSIEGARRSWMTPVTLPNLVRVLILWYPFGEMTVATLGRGLSQALATIGAAAAALPLAALGWSLLRRSRAQAAPTAANPWARLTASGLGVAAMFTMILWGLDRQGWVFLFYGPRYPNLTAACWGLGLAGAAGWACQRAGWPLRRALWLMLPYLACNLGGQGLKLVLDTQSGYRASLAEVLPSPPPGTSHDLYVMPSEFIPYLNRDLSRWRLHRVEELFERAPTAPVVTIFKANPWPKIDRERDLVIQAAWRANRLSETFYERAVELHRSASYTLAVLQGVRPEGLAALAREGLQARTLAAAPAARAVATPRQLHLTGGWQELEVDMKGMASRWSGADRARIELGQPLAPGRATVHLAFLRQPYPTPQAPLTLELDGTRYPVQTAVGWNELAVPVQLRRPLSRPVLTLEYPTWRPCDYPGQNPSDRRKLGILFFGLWVE